VFGFGIGYIMGVKVGIQKGKLEGLTLANEMVAKVLWATKGVKRDAEDTGDRSGSMAGDKPLTLN